MRHLAVVVCLLFAAVPMFAATFDLPTDAELLRSADVVVVGTVVDSFGREGADHMIYTDSRLHVEQVLKGKAASAITISEYGGFANGRGMIIDGSAVYTTGTRVLVFLEKRSDGTYYTSHMALGQYRFERNGAKDILVRDAEGIDTLAGDPKDTRVADAFLEGIRAGKPEEAPRVFFQSIRTAQPHSEATAASYLKVANGLPERWPGCDSGCLIGYFYHGSQTGISDPIGSIENAMSVWTDDPNSEINFGVGSSTATDTADADGENVILLSSNIGGPSFCSGGLACGIAHIAGSPYMFNGEQFWPIAEGDVIVRPTLGAGSFETVLAHELGHTIGFRHSNEGTPASSNALMNASVPGGLFLRRWDKVAVATAYGDGYPCENISVTGTSGGGSVPFGESAALSVTTNGPSDASYTYQWYSGATGNTSTPVSTSATYHTPAVTSTQQYWVRVTIDCNNTADSGTITVTPAACDPVAFTTQPQSKRINPGTSTTLSVAVTGSSPFTYQWYRSATSGDTTNPVGSNSSSYNTGTLNTTTSYWVRASNGCSTVDSEAATITVSSTCVPPAITNTSSLNVSLNPGQSTTMLVTPSGDSPFTYQWYQGSAPDTTTTAPGGTSASYTVGPFTTSGTFHFWVKITNACGNVSSETFTITIAPTCVPPTIVTQPGTVNVILGEGASVQAVAAGSEPFTYQWYEGQAGDASHPAAGQTTSVLNAGPFNTIGNFPYWVKINNACGEVGSATITFAVGCGGIATPLISTPGIVPYSTGYTVKWTGSLAATPSFELQEARDPLFTTGLRVFNVSGALSQHIDAHNDVTTETRFYYRVRALSVCNGTPTEWSHVASTVVTPPLPDDSLDFAISIPEGTSNVILQSYLVPGFDEAATNNDTFSIAIDVPWMTVFPSHGALSAGGTTVQFTIDPTGLDIGSTTATIQVTRSHGNAAGTMATNDGPTTTYTPFSVSLVTPVSPDPRDAGPPPGTLIIPAVAHAQGIGSPFRSDVRIVNVSFDDIDYEISYTPSQTDGTEEGKKTTVTIHAGDTLAFDDIVKAWYGAGVLGESGVGTVEIRPLNGADPAATYASSRTYALDDGGTLGQYIPALRLTDFVGNIANDSLGRISLQQVANSTNYRTNIGFAEGTGTPVSVLAKLLDGNSNVIAETTKNLSAFGHFQSSLTNLFGNVNLNDGRVEVEVTSEGGKVTAYASVLNNQTNDPLMVFPVQPQRNTAGRYVLAGIAEFSSPVSNFHSDMRIFNGGNQPVNVTLNYYDRGQTAPHPQAPARNITLQAGQVDAINDVLPTLWPGLSGGGSVVATAPSDSSLVLTAQTYSREADGGTKGQFIPGVSAAQGVGLGDRPMQVLQLEQSAQYRSNVGFVEITGKTVVIEVTAFEPDTKTTAVVPIGLQANEYRQFDRILEQMQLGTVYNGRVSIKVIEGEGRVYAYGSNVDNRTADPTYIPGQ